VVLKPGVDCSLDELRAHCLRELGRYKTPKEFRVIAELPKGPSGKVQRLKLVTDRGLLFAAAAQRDSILKATFTLMTNGEED
jgi:acyl-CoA synthetase (AMP-forming)/AMP-acid ligase II